MAEVLAGEAGQESAAGSAENGNQAPEIVAKPLPSWAHVRMMLNHLAKQRGEWAGVPQMLPDLPLTVESKYPYQGLQNAQLDEKAAPLADADDWEFRNQWDSFWHGRVRIWRNQKTGETYWNRRPMIGAERALMLLNTLQAIDAWSLKAETNAMDKLAGLLSGRMMQCYCLTGAFVETSKRSGVSYIFRRLGTTIAMKGETNMKILAALCMHPIGYYQGSHAGVMVPTDDVIAHLLLMRADEHRFWKLCNQHAAYSPEAGI